MTRDLLEVVQDHQATAAASNGLRQLNYGIAFAQRHPQPLRDREHDAIESPRLREITKPDTPRVVAQARPTEACHQPGFAAPANAEDRYEPRTFFQAPNQRAQC